MAVMEYLTSKVLNLTETSRSILLLAFSVFIVFQFRARSKKSLRSLPPGPKGLPILGNIFDLPPSGGKDWEYWAKHKDLYGPISSVTAAGTTLIILNNAKVTLDLMGKERYSSRPRLVFGGEMVGTDRWVTLKSNPAEVRAHRKLIHQLMGTKEGVSYFYKHQDVVNRRFLLQVQKNPEGLLDHIRTQTGSMILKSVYGYNVSPNGKDALVDLAVQAHSDFGKACSPGRWLVDIFPALRHVPDWMPGAGFKKLALEYHDTITKIGEIPYAFVRQQMRAGTHEGSYVSKHIEQAGPNMTKKEEDDIKWSAAVLYAAGGETIMTTLSSFYLAMALFPAAQHKAQAEIDRVVGDRLPTMDDQNNLPYVNAVMNEVMRWHPTVPLGFVHSASEDGTYEGYFIPKGSALIPNVWAILRDPTLYPDPEAFKPERFLDGHTPECDPKDFIFGFGRRICPGNTFAESGVFLNMARALKVFDIGKATRDGVVVEPVADPQPGIVSYLRPFEVSVKPRNAQCEALVRQVEKHQFTEGDSAELERIRG